MLAQPFNRRSGVSRIVGWVLLVFIVYGTTVEAAHKHGQVLTTPNTTSVEQTQNVDGSVGTKANCNDCLICQLHQNFSATLISLKVHAEALDSKTTVRECDAVSINTHASTPRKGRAPPQVN